MSTKAFVSLLADRNKNLDLKVVEQYSVEPGVNAFSTGKVTLESYKDGNQWAEATVTITTLVNESELVAKAKFTNKRKLDGDTFAVAVGALDSEGNILAAELATRGVNAMCSSIIKCETKTGTVTKNATIKNGSKIAAIILALGYRDTVNDKEFWKKAEKLGKKALELLRDDDENNDDGVEVQKEGGS